MDEVLRDKEILFWTEVKAVRKRKNVKRVGVKNKDKWVDTEKSDVCERRKECLEDLLSVERTAAVRSKPGVEDAVVPTALCGLESWTVVRHEFDVLSLKE